MKIGKNFKLMKINYKRININIFSHRWSRWLTKIIENKKLKKKSQLKVKGKIFLTSLFSIFFAI